MFYAGRFDRPPSVARLAGRPAARHRHWAGCGVHGLTYLPDPARQFVALAAGHPDPPGPAGPRPDEVPNPMSEGSYMLTDMFRLQHDLAKLYGDATVEDGR